MKTPPLGRDYRVEDLDFDALMREARGGGDRGRIAARAVGGSAHTFLRSAEGPKTAHALQAALADPDVALRAAAAGAPGKLKAGPAVQCEAARASGRVGASRAAGRPCT